MKKSWSHRQRAMFLTSVLSTAGDLAFVGDVDRYFRAFDVKSGRLWHTGSGGCTLPDPYAANGKQYRGDHRHRRVQAANRQAGRTSTSNGGAIYVFELPD
jgi:alcohol dehydrogenase (cytochrome c)